MRWMDVLPALLVALATVPAAAASSERASSTAARRSSSAEQLVCEVREGDRYRIVSLALTEGGSLTAIVDEEPVGGDAATTMATHDDLSAPTGLTGTYASRDGRFRLRVSVEAGTGSLRGSLRAILADGTAYEAPAMQCAVELGMDADD